MGDDPSYLLPRSPVGDVSAEWKEVPDKERKYFIFCATDEEDVESVESDIDEEDTDEGGGPSQAPPQGR